MYCLFSACVCNVITNDRRLQVCNFRQHEKHVIEINVVCEYVEKVGRFLRRDRNWPSLPTGFPFQFHFIRLGSNT